MHCVAMFDSHSLTFGSFSYLCDLVFDAATDYDDNGPPLPYTIGGISSLTYFFLASFIRLHTHSVGSSVHSYTYCPQNGWFGSVHIYIRSYVNEMNE